MKKQALVIRDKFDNADIAESLKIELTTLGFGVVEISSFDQIEDSRLLIDQNSPTLFYPNVFVRYNDPLMLWNFHTEHPGFCSLRIDYFPCSLMFKMVKSGHRYSCQLKSEEPAFAISNVDIRYEHPKEQPIMFMCSHSKDIYFKLTLNSLHFSLIEKFPIKILLNIPTNEVRKVALDFAAGKDYVEVLESDENLFISSTNVLMQWFKPKKFIIMEDDFILPISVKTYFPNWAFQFMDRLNTFDMVGWPVATENQVPFDPSTPRYSTNRYCLSDWEILNVNNFALLAGQCLAVNSSLYLDATRSIIHEHYTAYDAHMHARTTKKCIPSLRGYHIGYNQEMDGLIKLNARGIPPAVEKCNITSLTTGEKREIRLKDILSLQL